MTQNLTFLHKRLELARKAKIKNIIPQPSGATHTRLQLRQLAAKQNENHYRLHTKTKTIFMTKVYCLSSPITCIYIFDNIEDKITNGFPQVIVNFYQLLKIK